MDFGPLAFTLVGHGLELVLKVDSGFHAFVGDPVSVSAGCGSLCGIGELNDGRGNVAGRLVHRPIANQ